MEKGKIYYSDNESPMKQEEESIITTYVFDDKSYQNFKVEKATGLSRNEISTKLHRVNKSENEQDCHYESIK